MSNDKMRVLTNTILITMLILCLNELRLAIMRDQLALMGEFPACVAMNVNSTPHCGRTMIDEDQILTAAGCLFYEGNPIDDRSAVVVKPTDNALPTRSRIETQSIGVEGGIS